MQVIATQALAEKLFLTVPEAEYTLQLFDLSTTDVSLLASCRVAMFSKLNAIAKDIADQFSYNPQLARLIEEVSSADLFPKFVRDFLRSYFEGMFDEQYIHSRARLGALFFRFDVSAKKFLPLLAYMQQRVELEMMQSLGKTETSVLARTSFGKSVRLDTTLIIQGYLEAKAKNELGTENKIKEYAKAMEEKVERLTQSIEDLSQRDPLTGLYNQRGFYDNLYRELGNAKRHKWGLCVLYFDFNGFAQFNETEGRRIADKLLNIMAATMADTYRETDILCRYKDDEFCVIMPNTLAKDARTVCKRVIEKFRSRSSYSLAFCIGLAQTGPKDFISLDDLFNNAYENVKVAQGAISDKGEFYLKG